MQREDLHVRFPGGAVGRDVISMGWRSEEYSGGWQQAATGLKEPTIWGNLQEGIFKGRGDEVKSVVFHVPNGPNLLADFSEEIKSGIRSSTILPGSVGSIPSIGRKKCGMRIAKRGICSHLLSVPQPQKRYFIRAPGENEAAPPIGGKPLWRDRVWLGMAVAKHFEEIHQVLLLLSTELKIADLTI
jgi:hypothetical protein